MEHFPGPPDISAAYRDAINRIGRGCYNRRQVERGAVQLARVEVQPARDAAAHAHARVGGMGRGAGKLGLPNASRHPKK